MRQRDAVFYLLLDYPFIYLFQLESVSLYVALAALELIMQTRLALNLQKSTCLCLPAIEH